MDVSLAATLPLASSQDAPMMLSPLPSRSRCSSQGVLSRAVPSVPHTITEGSEANGPGRVFRILIFGLINAVVLVPIMVGFAQVIFRDPFFTPYRPLLVKAVLFSSVVHQLVFTLTSSLTFAVGQVQDAGLIFLSAMAAACVQSVNTGDAAEVVSTTLVTLALATALLGVALILTGVFKLASYVQYLPQPVVSGYLAFIGLFCFQAGLALMTAESIENVGQWSKVLHWNSFRLLLPGVVVGVLLYVILRRFRHFAVLPSLLVFIPIGFFVVLLCANVSLQEARDLGWVDSDTSIVQFWHVWNLFDFSKVRWGTMIHQLPTWFGMYFVVAFSSCLDVAAIQLDLGKKLDFNHELKTVGISNIVSGLTGGFTGSYIFSQTIFTMRSGIDSRLVGVVIIACEIAIFTLPFSILAYVPRLFFGAILTFIAIDLVIEHLLESYHTTNLPSYVIVWTTFIAINVFGLELGMLVGIGATALQFVIQYARFGHPTRRVAARSRVFREFAHRRLLDERSQEIVALQISGYIFFGSALKLLEDIKRQVLVAVQPIAASEPQLMPLSIITDAVAKVPVCEGQTSFLLLDFARVSGLDTTAACNCFKPLRQLLREHAIVLLFTNLDKDTRRILERQDVIRHEDLDVEPGIESDVCVFESLDRGIEWCEKLLLQRHGDLVLSGLPSPTSTDTAKTGLIHTLAKGISSAPVAANLLSQPVEDHEHRLLALEKYFERLELAKGSNVFSVGDASDAMYVIESGEVVLTTKTANRVQRYEHGGIFGDLDFFLQRPRSFTALAVSDCVLWQLPQKRFSQLASEHPDQLATLQLAVVQGLCLSSSGVLDDYFSDQK